MNAPEKAELATSLAKVESGHDRTKYLGGSDVAAALGLSKWRTPLELYLDKADPGWRGDTADEDKRKAKIFRRGKLLEPVVCRMLAEDFGLDITRLSTDESPNRYIDQEHPWMVSEVDFEFRVTEELLDVVPEWFIPRDLIGTIQNGEIKTVHPLAAHLWGEEFSDSIPVDYYAQSMHGLGVTGRQICLYGVLFGADNLTLYAVPRDDETIKGMRKRLVEFWHKNVQARVKPDPMSMEDIKHLYMKFNGVPVELTQEEVDRFYRLGSLRSTAKQAEEERDFLELELAKSIAARWKCAPEGAQDDAELRFGDKVIGTWKRTRGANLDQKALKATHPDITALFTREYHYRAFRAKKQS